MMGQLQKIARAQVIWLLSAALGWIAVLLPELVEPGSSPLARIIYAVRLSGTTAVLASVPLAVLHAIAIVAPRLRLPPLTTSTLLAAVGLAYPLWQQAVFLTSGDAISDSRWQLPVRFAFFAGAMAAGLGLWWWHRFCVRPVPLGAGRAARRMRWGAWIAGVLALWGLYHVLHYELRTYAYLARTLMVVAWLVAGTVTYRVLSWLPLPAAVSVAGLLAIGVFVSARISADELEVERNALLREGELVALTELLVHERSTAAASYDLSLAHPVDCVPPAGRRVPPAPPIPEQRRRNVLFVSFDALRADAIGSRVPRRGQRADDAGLLMPNLTTFAARSMNYARAVTTYPATLMALGGALTGLGPSDLLLARQRPKNVFVRTREHFDEQFIALPASRWFSLPIIDSLFVQGTRVARHRDARLQTSWMIAQLSRARRQDKRVFAWLHYFEPHKPYQQHDGYDYGSKLRDRYYGELGFVDREFGRFMRYLEQGRWFDDTLVIVFSDHGQALGERSFWGHHVYLNSWITDIPLLLRAPGQEPGRSLKLVSITDIMPTVMDFVGAPYSPDEFSGRSLFAAARKPTEPPRVVFAEAFPVRGKELFELTNQPITSIEALARRIDRVQRGARNYLPKVAAITAGHRLIVNRVTGATELYDRARDRQETQDLSRYDRGRVRRLSQALRRFTHEQSRRLYCAVEARPR